ncbi:MAG: nicotinate-nucleotide adenylyltransferase [Salinivirgaceae bacterium]|nr:nicotinate-nucleotide adenylyltransferase [Salinivirgaceae bacterium]
MLTGLYFGSFNPIHIGHLALANYITAYTDVDEVWFVVSPQNPFKQREQLLDDQQRLHLVNIALRDFPKFRSSNIEFSMPKPSYTIDTLAYLREKFPTHDFTLIMGEDNLVNFHKWKNADLILKDYSLTVYPRPNCTKTEMHNHPKVKLIDAPKIEISSSFIRQSIAEGRNVQFFVPEAVWKYIDEMNFYKKR